MKGQITLTVAEAKRLIAKAVISRLDVQDAIQTGRVLLKGGTTVSAISEELTGSKLRIGGRITPRGTMNALKKYNQPHCVLIQSGKLTNIDQEIEDVIGNLQRNDVIITSANALDIHGNAGMMAAAPLGYKAGKAISSCISQGVKVIIAIGLEKLIPGTIKEAAIACGRISIDKSLGAAVGLVPIIGEIFTEKEAISILADVDTTVIAAGGIGGAEGATTMVVDGPKSEVEKVFKFILSIKGSDASGTPESMVECEGGCPQCKKHQACIYKLED